MADIDPERILRSSKVPGRFESRIIGTLGDHFRSCGYHVIPHARFDIAWGAILSDLDLLLVREDQLTVIEVKSSRDHLARAAAQIDRCLDFADAAYIATDYYPRVWPACPAGRIVVDNNTVDVLQEPGRPDGHPDARILRALDSLRKSSLVRLLPGYPRSHIVYDMARAVYASYDGDLKHAIKCIVTCQDVRFKA